MKHIFFLFFGLLMVAGLQAQKRSRTPGREWYQKKPDADTMGIDLYRTYENLLAGRTASDVVVAVIDGGTDISHPDLVGNIWHNPKEIPFNNVDDDHNGYVDDTVGWNFIGNPGGECVRYDNLEKVRLLRDLEDEFADVDKDDINDDPVKRGRYAFYEKLKAEVLEERRTTTRDRNFYQDIILRMKDMRKKSHHDDPTKEDIEKYAVTSSFDKYVKSLVRENMKSGMTFNEFLAEVEEAHEHLKSSVEYQLNVSYDPRDIVQDKYRNSGERYYGNNNVRGPEAKHGTHVAGIIGAMRHNDIGMNGIADHVKLMIVRVVPDGDERDKDVANGIRYAVDNGAKIINMSFGKRYKFNKAVVDSAVRYAVSKGVLLVHAAGNDFSDNDVVPNYPNDSLGHGDFAATWLEVGANFYKRKRLPAQFSNYGGESVDLFAPGYQIYSTVDSGQYDFLDGTSMAAPVVSGVAALVWSYFPQLSALELKDILMASVVKTNKKMPKPGGGRVRFGSLCVSGGVVNAYNAVKLAGEKLK